MQKLFLLLSFLLSGVVTWAQTDPSTSLNESALLWEVKGEDESVLSYIFGTIHMIDKKDFFMPDELKQAINDVEQVAFEINMEEMNDLTKMMGLITKAYMNNDTTLQDLLTDNEYKTVESHFNKIGLPIMFLNRIKPMFLSAFASEDLMKIQTNPSEIKSYEMEIMQLAKLDDKTIGGLETAEYQMSLFDSIPYKIQAQMLMKSITSESTGENEFKEMVELYKSQDIEGMQAMMKEDEEGIGRYENLLLINRNVNWIPVIQEMMKKGPTLFAVGAGHLGGEMGILNLLRKEGFQLNPVK